MFITGAGTTPTAPLSKDVLDFCAGISGDFQMYLPFTLVDFRYKPQQCFINVLHRVRENGGSCLYGWVIWQSPYFIEAEHHAVWKAPDGRVLDITPRVDGEKSVLFVPDKTATIDRRPGGDLLWENIIHVPAPTDRFGNGRIVKARRGLLRSSRPPAAIASLVALGFDPTISLADGKV